jgi:hypothetical protein
LNWSSILYLQIGQVIGLSPLNLLHRQWQPPLGLSNKMKCRDRKMPKRNPVVWASCLCLCEKSAKQVLEKGFTL